MPSSAWQNHRTSGCYPLDCYYCRLAKRVPRQTWLIIRPADYADYVTANKFQKELHNLAVRRNSH